MRPSGGSSCLPRYQSRAITASASRRIRATSSRAGSSRSSGAPWPAQSESKPESPALAAAARISRVSAFWTGKGASGSPDISRVNRFPSPRAARPEKARVITVESSRAWRNAARYGPLVPASGQRRKAVPKETALAPRARAAAKPRPSMTPPAAITGTRTASATCGTSARVPISAGSASRSKVPRWPPASAPWAQMKSTPACSSARASATVVAVPMVRIPDFRQASSISRGGMPKVKLKTGTRSSSSTGKASRRPTEVAGGPGGGNPSSVRYFAVASCAACKARSSAATPSSANKFTANGRDVAARMARISSRSFAGATYAPPCEPSPPASLTAAQRAGVDGPPAIGASTSGCWMPIRSVKAVGRIAGNLECLLVDLHVLGLVDEERADHHRHQGHHDRVPESRVDVPCLGDDGRRQQGEHASEPAVADVIRQGHRGVADLRREQLDQERGDGSVDHGHVDHHDDKDELGHHPVDAGQVGLGRVAAALEGRAVLCRIEAPQLEGADPGDDLVAPLGGLRLERQSRLAEEVLRLVTGRLVRPGTDEDVEVAVGSVNGDRRILLVGFQGRVDVMSQPPEERKVRHGRDQAASQDDLFAADAVGKRPEDEEEGRTDDEGESDQDVRGDEVQLEIQADEKERVELTGVPDDALPGRCAEQRQRDVLVVRVLEEAVLDRCLRTLPLGLEPREDRRLLQLQSDVDGDCKQRDRKPERNSPATRPSRWSGSSWWHSRACGRARAPPRTWRRHRTRHRARDPGLASGAPE